MPNSMKFTIKTLDQKTFHVEFDETKTVWDLKTHLCNLPEVGVEPEQQQLIYAGRVLENEQVLNSYSIDERKFLVMMAKKSIAAAAKSAPSPGMSPKAEGATKSDSSAKEQTTSDATTFKSIDQPGPSKRKNDQQPAQQKVRPKAQHAAASPTAVAQAPSPTNSVLRSMAQAPIQADDALVRDIVNMGYAESDVRRALVASFNNPDRAIEYLIEGIPEFPGMFAQPSDMQGDDSNPLSFLRNDPRFHQMRRIIQQRPDLLSMVLAKIGESNPALLALIREHQDEFVRMVNDSDDLTDSDETNDDPVAIVLSTDDRLAVERLMALGFPRDLVVQAYFACEKNEEQTADFLCRQLEDN